MTTRLIGVFRKIQHELQCALPTYVATDLAIPGDLMGFCYARTCATYQHATIVGAV